jgi:hypothetical protein
LASVYIETSIISYATSRLSPKPHILVRQQDARRWWALNADRFDLHASQAVVAEASQGDAAAAKERLQLLAKVQLIPVTDQVRELAVELVSRALLPANASVDALHVAAAAIGSVDYLLTLNCRHIANAFMLPRIYAALDELGVSQPLICTPEEFLGEAYGR